MSLLWPRYLFYKLFWALLFCSVRSLFFNWELFTPAAGTQTLRSFEDKCHCSSRLYHSGFLTGQARPLFVYIRSSQRQLFRNIVDFSGIWLSEYNASTLTTWPHPRPAPFWQTELHKNGLELSFNMLLMWKFAKMWPYHFLHLSRLCAQLHYNVFVITKRELVQKYDSNES